MATYLSCPCAHEPLVWPDATPGSPPAVRARSWRAFCQACGWDTEPEAGRDMTEAVALAAAEHHHELEHG